MSHAPDAVALRDEPAKDNESSILIRRDNLQPDAGHHQTHCKARQPGGQAAKKRGGEKKTQAQSIQVQFIHSDRSPERRGAALEWSPSDGEAACPRTLLRS